MRLKHLFPNLNKELKEKKIRGISEDSRITGYGDLFFVKERKNFDIFSVLNKVEDKVVAFVSEEKNKEKLKRIISKKPIIFVKNIEEDFCRVVDRFYGFNKDDFKFIGVTGTNGKTTVTSLIYHLLKKIKKECALLGTVKYILGDEAVKANYTTPDYLTLRKIFKRIKDKGIKYVVMEVSSHAIDQQRIKGIDFLGCVFTNLSRDHLDYHKTMKSYFETKKKLFTLNPPIFSLINIDDYYGYKIFKEVKNAFSYGTKNNAHFKAKKIKCLKEKSQFLFIYKNDSYLVDTPLLGKYNILNVLASISILSLLGFPLKKLTEGVASFKGVEGRLEKVYPDIFIDYAHTPDALRNVLLTLREIGYKKIICVFGCGGERDQGKRKIMGKVASIYADFSFVTSDNPRNEDPLKICKEVERGFLKKNYSRIIDRKKAIKKAIKLKNKMESCCVIIAGKGHEEYQIIANKRIPFNDKKIVKEITRK
jgi:UDP-N-acetylmuramoyl-L-alanyl-D-glutamate--2,6-diaminopimelate ligase